MTKFHWLKVREFQCSAGKTRISPFGIHQVVNLDHVSIIARGYFCLTGLHVEQQVLAVLLRLLNVLLQLSSFARREHGALFAVRQEVGKLGLQVIQDLLPL